MTNHIKIFGAVCIKEGKKKTEYIDDEIAKLVGNSAGAYGRHWTYAGDQGFDESTILITNNADHVTFVGRTGLGDALKHLEQLQ